MGYGPFPKSDVDFWIEEIPFAASRAAREIMAHDPRLVEDAWDASSRHFGLYAHAQLVATYRIVAPRDGRLPVHDHAPDLAVEAQDRQVGRLVALRELATPSARASFFAAYLVALGREPGRMYVATAEKGPISARRWEKLGFARTGVAYRDSRYREPLLILVRPAI